MTKVVTFGAFVEILPGVEGLVHISELAQHHVENPREVVSQGDEVQAKIIEIDAERRRLSLSLKRASGDGEEGDAPPIVLTEEIFSGDDVPRQAPPRREPRPPRERESQGAPSGPIAEAFAEAQRAEAAAAAEAAGDNS